MPHCLLRARHLQKWVPLDLQGLQSDKVFLSFHGALDDYEAPNLDYLQRNCNGFPIYMACGLWYESEGTLRKRHFSSANFWWAFCAHINRLPSPVRAATGRVPVIRVTLSGSGLVAGLLPGPARAAARCIQVAGLGKDSATRLRPVQLVCRLHPPQQTRRTGPAGTGRMAKIYSQAELDRAVSAALSAVVREKDEII